MFCNAQIFRKLFAVRCCDFDRKILHVCSETDCIVKMFRVAGFVIKEIRFIYSSLRKHYKYLRKN
jgi:hypothetical protein